MSIRATLIEAVNSLELKTGKPVGLQEVKQYLKITHAKVGGALWQVAGDGFLKKSKVSGYSGNIYKPTAKGREFLANEPPIYSHEELVEWCEVGTTGMRSGSQSKAATAAVSRRYGGKAKGAIESIAALVDTNDELLNTIRVIHSQLSRVLDSHSDVMEEEEDEVMQHE